MLDPCSSSDCCGSRCLRVRHKDHRTTCATFTTQQVPHSRNHSGFSMVDRDAWGDSYLTVESDILGFGRDAAVQSSLRPWAHSSHVPLQGSSNTNGLEPRDTKSMLLTSQTTRILPLLLLLVLLLQFPIQLRYYCYWCH